ncbi:hypothetical protein DT019_37250 [Streptomyces sp. SDr-06]|uniref:hypothetical protein n=1 Tax=Streptomyces sp. SDr-06 TaxID=2267702 RepID=UPI000DEB6C9B|nr:hypothetical protein [Streptomyces sp. SDr-06]RCH61663.1 hypothetical protein DT019_37250 [Streptomyces sp. SDr-06]
MAAERVIVVYPPDETGGRRVRVDGTILGRARDLRDLTEYLRRAGLEGLDDLDVVRSLLIEWRGGGPEDWDPRPP